MAGNDLSDARRRSQSRASTSSLHSASTQPNIDHGFADLYSTQWLDGGDHHHHHHQAQPKGLTAAAAAAGGHPLTPEEIILQAASQLEANPEFGGLDTSMTTSVAGNGSQSFHHHSHANGMGHQQSLQGDSFSADNSFAELDSQLAMERDPNEEGDSSLALAGPPKPSRSSANNELEMRQLFNANQSRSLQEVAEELHGNERGPNSERTRQVFAMLWINLVCSKGKGSVPRGRVYANYASRCATERITVLNPASFGKLVRVLFPGLKTRRLGVRGESKYHYVNFTLIEDETDTRDSPKLRQVPLLDISFSQTSSADTEPFSQSDPLVLPRIEPFLPAGTDPDAAKSLTALYRSHCTSLVECIRYCKEKTFFHLFTSFQGTLTMPVQKLFAHPSVTPWIEECDFVLYHRMMRIISGLTLQVVPKPVLDTLRSISERLVPHIRDSFQGQPAHVIRAKEAPATLFAGLLDRALRVNLTAHAAANMLSNPANRDQMYIDWITLVRIRKIAECIPARGMDDLVNLILSELRSLLDPINIAWEVESMTLYGQMAARNGPRMGDASNADGGASNVLDRWVNFLQSLPERFPYASHRNIVWCVQRVGTAVMRDLTIQQGKSFGSWWVTKCWIDEMVSFLAEQGGFLRQTSSQQDLLKGSQDGGLIQKHMPVGRDLSRRGGRYRTESEDSGLQHVTQSQPDRAPFPSAPVQGGSTTSHDVLNMGNGSPDDSGIGIRTPDEDFPMEKFTFSNAESQELMASAGLH
ncbi:DNA damage and replication checkpoint protein [Grosmannia clavigera kw1407]|uniref:DNA damage and replication checkpoint protein n=1 Tax=Grosmannia clavigera (strain kw1407 / UAMH 11150) TaxID=655863 RepID=F0XM75_GROCL|nr:DNA damage and replication checkpoint protein [Grosmannia clavigera kw1407]EFX01018.1 DNA damage and replication checkpoint protein [Grosmannia clavigera kw1407]